MVGSGSGGPSDFSGSRPLPPLPQWLPLPLPLWLPLPLPL